MSCSFAEIDDFLCKIRFFGNVPGCFILQPRDKNLKIGLAELGMSVEEVKTIIFGLTPYNYVKGPETDRNFPDQNIWVFGYDHSGTEIYIKLSGSVSKDHRNIVNCISFHKSTGVLTYPFKKGGS